MNLDFAVLNSERIAKTDSDIRSYLLRVATTGLQRQAGYIPPAMPIPSVDPMTLALPLMRVRKEPTREFYLHDALYEWLHDDVQMPCEVFYLERDKFNAATKEYRKEFYRTNTIAQFCRKLRLYVGHLDKIYYDMLKTRKLPDMSETGRLSNYVKTPENKPQATTEPLPENEGYTHRPATGISARIEG